MFLHVIHAQYLHQYKLRLTCNNQVVKEVDLYNELDGEIFEALKDLEFFQRVTVNSETSTIEWPNGADFAPEFLFEIGQTVDMPQHQQVFSPTWQPATI